MTFIQKHKMKSLYKYFAHFPLIERDYFAESLAIVAVVFAKDHAKENKYNFFTAFDLVVISFFYYHTALVNELGHSINMQQKRELISNKMIIAMSKVFKKNFPRQYSREELISNIFKMFSDRVDYFNQYMKENCTEEDFDPSPMFKDVLLFDYNLETWKPIKKTNIPILDFMTDWTIEMDLRSWLIFLGDATATIMDKLIDSIKVKESR